MIDKNIVNIRELFKTNIVERGGCHLAVDSRERGWMLQSVIMLDPIMVGTVEIAWCKGKNLMSYNKEMSYSYKILNLLSNCTINTVHITQNGYLQNIHDCGGIDGKCGGIEC